MKKKWIVLLSMVLLWGCQPHSQKDVVVKSLPQQATLLYFYIETCADCQAFQEDAIPYLQATFEDQLVIKQYDLDDEKTAEVYDRVVDSLDNFDESLYGMGPFYAIDGYFAKVGYTSGDEEYLVNDIEKALLQKELSDELSGLRFSYRKS